jgi:hypothetical protein
LIPELSTHEYKEAQMALSEDLIAVKNGGVGGG